MAMAFPMPFDAPVMSAFFPLSKFIVVLFKVPGVRQFVPKIRIHFMRQIFYFHRLDVGRLAHYKNRSTAGSILIIDNPVYLWQRN
jgi:hypothetical protein